MRARRYVLTSNSTNAHSTLTQFLSIASKLLASTRSQPSSTEHTKHHDNHKTNLHAHTAHLIEISSNPDHQHRLDDDTEETKLSSKGLSDATGLTY